MTIEEEASVSRPFSLTSADKTICVGAAVYAAIALAYQHVPSEVLACLAFYFPVSRIDWPWLKQPVDAIILSICVAIAQHGGVPFFNAWLFASIYLAGRIGSKDLLQTRIGPKKTTWWSRTCSVVGLAIAAIAVVWTMSVVIRVVFIDG